MNISNIGAIQIEEEEPSGVYGWTKSCYVDLAGFTVWVNDYVYIHNKLYDDLKKEYPTTPIYAGADIINLNCANSSAIKGIKADGWVNDW